MAKRILSKKNQFIKEDWLRWGRNAIIFSSPAIIVFLTALQQGADFKSALFVVYPAIINLFIDWVRKLKAETKY